MSEEIKTLSVLYRDIPAKEMYRIADDPHSSVLDLIDVFAERDRLIEQNRELLEALREIHNEVEGNIEPTVRDLVNQCGRNTPTNPNEIYGYCERIEEIIRKATGEEA